MIAVYPMDWNSPPQQRAGTRIERPIALNIAKDDRRARQFAQLRKAALDLVPHLVDVTDKYDRHFHPGYRVANAQARSPKQARPGSAGQHDANRSIWRIGATSVI
jgi:hypothetical protein